MFKFNSIDPFVVTFNFFVKREFIVTSHCDNRRYKGNNFHTNLSYTVLQYTVIGNIVTLKKVFKELRGGVCTP